MGPGNLNCIEGQNSNTVVRKVRTCTLEEFYTLQIQLRPEGGNGKLVRAGGVLED